MVLVGFDTATADTAVCAWRDGEVLQESLLGPADGGPQHTTALLEEVERCAAAAGDWEQVGLLAVGLGPGSFTGLRIGIATARGLGAGLGLPVTGVCTLDAIAQAMADPSGNLVVLDARRGEVFAGLYTEEGERVWGPLVCRPEELEEKVVALAAPPSAAGSGAVRFRHELARHGVRIADDADPVHRVAARHICALAAASPDGGPLAPIYLRPPDAERWRERNSFQKAE
ncbi:MAG TPA: tRNA (adenosine(37)-N6)-threonylcarbamoyltransferase complex dimerization subunit type 1 TsaB [Solirubrobacterales bacterium]|nr:tRNA (adenosine(37)-N6)-threonylcarbamoyltransferase complex dimerization subunit type 1 TsaB [Solirubrobacterales bacterium]